MVSRTNAKLTKATKTHEKTFLSTIRFGTGSLNREVFRACFVTFVSFVFVRVRVAR